MFSSDQRDYLSLEIAVSYAEAERQVSHLASGLQRLVLQPLFDLAVRTVGEQEFRDALASLPKTSH